MPEVAAPSKESGAGFTADTTRMNVALTRAKTGIVVAGDYLQKGGMALTPKAEPVRK